MVTLNLSKDQAVAVRDRMEIEISYGECVYTPYQLKCMQAIYDKLVKEIGKDDTGKLYNK